MKRLKVLFWWFFLIRKNEFSHKLDSFLTFNKLNDYLLVRRDIAYDLTVHGWKHVYELNVDKFRLSVVDFLPKRLAIYIDTVCFIFIKG